MALIEKAVQAAGLMENADFLMPFYFKQAQIRETVS